MNLHVHLEKFDGPLGLLLHLIRKEEMDIFDINIHQITSQYLEYVKTMKQLDLENAGEFVALAATLIHIKSRMLLPQYNEEGEVVETEDPRKELVRRLVEYQKFQDASRRLYERPLVGRDVWLRGERLEIPMDEGDDVVVGENALFALISAYRGVLRSVKNTVHNVSMALQSVSSRILELRERLVMGMQVRFSELVTVPASHGGEARANQVLVTFLSLLELAKIGLVSLFQSDNQSEIFIQTKQNIERDVVVRVESYDGAHATAGVESLMSAAAAAEPPQEEEIATDEEILAEEQRLLGAAGPEGEVSP